MNSSLYINIISWGHFAKKIKFRCSPAATATIYQCRQHVCEHWTASASCGGCRRPVPYMPANLLLVPMWCLVLPSLSRKRAFLLGLFSFVNSLMRCQISLICILFPRVLSHSSSSHVALFEYFDHLKTTDSYRKRRCSFAWSNFACIFLPHKVRLQIAFISL